MHDDSSEDVLIPSLKKQIKFDLNLDDKFTEMLLDIYYEITGLSIVFNVAGNDKPIYSKKYWPKFCVKACEIIGHETCTIKYPPDKIKGIFKCNAGLWCYSHPVTINGEVVGAFLVGHRRIHGKNKESKKALVKFLDTHKDKLNEKTYTYLVKLWEQSDIVDNTIFDFVDVKLLEKLSFIERYVLIEHQRAIDEHKRAISYQKESTSLAHEFLLPIQSIIADAENLYYEADEGGIEAKNIAEDILQQVTKLYYIAENIRGSILEPEVFRYELKYENILDIINETIKLFRKEAIKKYVIINDPVIKGIPSSDIEISKPHIKQVLFNLIHNAVKYSFRGRVDNKRYIAVVCKPYEKILKTGRREYSNICNNYYCIEIINYGIGIKPHEISEGLIFKDGYRGELSLDRSRTGSGFGLGRVKEIVELHNGLMTVKSICLGIGDKSDPYKTTIKICIPFFQMEEPKWNKN